MDASFFEEELKDRLYVSFLFSTRNRSPLLFPEIREQLRRYMEDISWETCYIRTLAVGGSENHVHFLLGLPSPIKMPWAARLMKDISAEWINDNIGDISNFEWQEGYKAFSISTSMAEKIVRYIGQKGRDYDLCRRFFQSTDFF